MLLCFTLPLMKIRILHHDRCFDGACSAALFSNFVRRKLSPGADLCYTGLYHHSEQLFDESLFDGDTNVIVDFKYSPSDRVTWWFDHHQSAFLSAEDEEHFRKDSTGYKFYDAKYKSCTKFIADILARNFEFDSTPLADLVHWADILDGAQYKNAQDAVTMPQPAMKLNLIIESAEQSMSADVIPLLESDSIDSIVSRPEYTRVFQNLYEKHLQNIELIRERAVCSNGVVFFDLVDSKLKGYNKFVPYYLFPDSIYTVSILDGGYRAKISVGSNPWAPKTPSHNLADICEHYGGGGHSGVGAISYAAQEFDKARTTAAQIVELLSQD